MSYLEQMTPEEIEFICSVIPQEYAIVYFRKNRKSFSKLAPGFRVKSFEKNTLELSQFLIRNSKKDFISTFIENVISNWVKEINEALQEYTTKGIGYDVALIKTLPLSFFNQNIQLFLKLKGDSGEISNLNIIQHAVSEIRNVLEAKTDSKGRINELTRIIDQYESKIRRIQNKTEKDQTKIENLKNEIETKKLDIYEQKEQINELNARLKEELEKNKNLQTKLNQLVSDEERRIRQNNKNLKAVEQDYDSVTKELEQNRLAIAQLEKQSEDYKDEIKELAQQIKNNEDLKQKYDLVMVNLEAKEMRVNQLLAQIQESDHYLNEIGEELAELEKIKQLAENKEKEIKSPVEKLNLVEEEQNSRGLQELENIIITFWEALDGYKRSYPESIVNNLLNTSTPSSETLNSSQYEYPKPRVPKDIEDFRAKLSFLQSRRDFTEATQLHSLFLDFVSDVIFHGIPIVIAHDSSDFLAKAIALALLGSDAYQMLEYNEGITVDQIHHFVSNAGRVLVLDNFIGNFNENLLVPLFEKHKDKIIFITTYADRAFNFVSDEFFRNGIYLNYEILKPLALGRDIEPQNEPLEEIEMEITESNFVERYLAVIEEISRELELPQSMAVVSYGKIKSHHDIYKVLVFSILPYSRFVKKNNPFSMSERLKRYLNRHSGFAIEKVTEWLT